MKEELAAFPAIIGANLIGKRILYWPVLVSTMATARQMAEAGVDEGTVVIAGEQTGGQGRMGRVWLSPKGSLNLSIVLCPKLEKLPYLNMAAALATSQSIKDIAGIEVEIKWPNDVLVRRKKVAGILVESRITKEHLLYAIIGIGINVNFPAVTLGELSQRATTLSDEVGTAIPVSELLKKLLLALDKLYFAPSEEIYQRWSKSLITLGQRVCLQIDGSKYDGIAEAVDREGSLLLRLDDGRLLIMPAGEVTSFISI